MKTKILKLLRETQEHISGQELCNHLGVSRTAVWKVINQLKEEGYEIEAVQNKGYQLLYCPNIMTDSEIGSRLVTKWIGKKRIFLSSVDSTNNEAKRRAEGDAENGTLFVTEKQTSGRGRRGREWDSQEGTTVLSSLLLRPDFSPDRASMLTLVMALSLTRAIEKLTDLQCDIKWPNDLVVNGKKICGILTEMNAELDYIHYIVIGFGINVNAEQFPEELAQKATSLKMECGREINRSQLLAEAMRFFEEDYNAYLKKLDLSLLLEAYNAHLINREKQVKVLEPKGEYEGVSKGINELGELLVEKENGEILKVYAGEVSVRGMHGYI